MNKMNHIAYPWILALTTALVVPHAAWANMVDYGSLESLFGEPITTSAIGTPQRASEVAANMTIITADEIRQSGSRSIPEILSRVPGLNILREGEDSYDVGIRGYQQPLDPRLLVLVDGRQVFIDDYSRTDWVNIPVNIDDIRQIEVVKGASSALFGSNAAGGVVNIVTYSPIYDHNNVTSVSAGTQRMLTEDATVTGRADWGGTKFSAGGMNADEFDTSRIAGIDQIPPAPPLHRYITSSSALQVNPDFQVNSEFTYSESTDNMADPQAGYLTGVQRLNTGSARIREDWQTPYGLISNDNYFNHSNVNLLEPAGGPTSQGAVTNLIFTQLQDQFRVGAAHTFRISAEYRYKDFTVSEPRNVEPISPKIADDNEAISGAWLWNMTDKLSWTNAMRYDRQGTEELGQIVPGGFLTASDYSHAHYAFSANSNFIYKWTDADTFRLGYGRGIQFPSLVENGGVAFHAPGATLLDLEGNPYLKPTIVQDWSADYDRKLADIFSDAKFSVFYEMNDSIIAPYVLTTTKFIFGAVRPVLMAQNIGNSHGIGGEFELKGNHCGIRWDASYSLAHVSDTALVLSKLDYSDSSPEQQFRLNLGYTTGPWEFDVYNQYVTSTDMLRGTVSGAAAPMLTDGYASVSGRIGYKINERFTVAASGTNLNQGVTKVSPFPQIERQVMITLTGKF